MAEETNEILVGLRAVSGRGSDKRTRRLILLAADHHINIDTIASTAKMPEWKVRKILQERK